MHAPAPDRKAKPRDTQDASYRLRAHLWDRERPASFTPRVAECGRKRVSEYVEVKAGGEGSSLGGVSTCSSVWHCPCCSGKIAARRSRELQDIIRAWQADQVDDQGNVVRAGGSVLLMTLTLSHSAGMPLASTWDALGVGWKAVRNGGGWRKDRAAHQIAGYCRVVEVTHGANGWHPHAHVLLFVAGDPSDADCEALRASVFGRWQTALAGAGYRTVEFDPATGKAVGVDVRKAGANGAAYVGEYVAKFGYRPRADAAGLALEAGRGDLKRGRKGSRTPWEILDAAAAGDQASSALWDEWERASHGRRQYAWAQGFVGSLDVDQVLTDAEAAEREDAHHAAVALLRAPAWDALVSNLRAYRNLPGAPLMTRMLDKAATLDGPAFRQWLTLAGIEHVDPADVAGAGAGMPVLPPVERGTFAHAHHRSLVRAQARTARRHQPDPLAPALAGARPRSAPVEPPRRVVPLGRPADDRAARIRALYGV